MTTITLPRAVVEQALEAWQRHQHGECALETVVARFDALRAALAQEQAEPVQEPVKFWPLAPLTGYYDVGGKRVWLEKDEPFPHPTPPKAEPLPQLAQSQCPHPEGHPSLRDAWLDGWEAAERAYGIGEQDDNANP